jgi:hypothetical protein
VFASPLRAIFFYVWSYKFAHTVAAQFIAHYLDGHGAAIDMRDESRRYGWCGLMLYDVNFDGVTSAGIGQT